MPALSERFIAARFSMQKPRGLHSVNVDFIADVCDELSGLGFKSRTDFKVGSLNCYLYFEDKQFHLKARADNKEEAIAIAAAAHALIIEAVAKAIACAPIDVTEEMPVPESLKEQIRVAIATDRIVQAAK